jgi:uncharacterized protein YfdQ (DUF2303 family)
MTQSAFADWIDQNMEDLTSERGKETGFPPPVAVLEMARSLQIHTKGRYERQINPTTGDHSLVCKQESESSSTPIPRAFLLALPVFEGGEFYRVEARIRLQMRDGAPLFTYVLHRRAEIERDAFGSVRKQVALEGKVQVFAGRPE